MNSLPPPEHLKRQFFRWLGSKFLSNIGRKLLETALTWEIYQRTKDPLALGIIGLCEALPFVFSSLWAGALVDRQDKRPVILLAESALFFCAILYLGFTQMSEVPLIFLYAVVGLIGSAISFGSVASNAYAQTRIPKDIFPRAIALNLFGFTASTILGPIAAGFILKTHSAFVVYLLSTLFFIGSFSTAWGLDPLPVEKGLPPVSAWGRMREGWAFVLSQPKILACMSLDMVAVLFGDCVALFPIFADRWGWGPLGYGLLRASPPLGAALVSAYQAARDFIRPTWKNLQRVVTVFGVSMIGFALSPNLFVGMGFLILGGVVDGISVVIRQSVYQANTPDALRGRVASVSGIFISASNEIGYFESGVTARLMGPVGSVLLGGTMTLSVVLAMNRFFRRKINEIH